MKTKVVVMIVFGFFSTLLLRLSADSADKTIALAIKIIQDVSRKPVDLDWTKAKKGDLLYSGDYVRTGDRSIAIVKFKDNSMLRVREKSELKVIGEQKEGVFSKTVAVERGEFSFDIQKQENEQFTFTSPTSVASIRGTQGLMQSEQSGDIVTVIEGLINLLNTSSNNSVNVGAGQTGLSRRDGTIDVRNASKDESSRAENAVRAGRSGGVEKKLEIELEDAQGEKQLLRIRYRD